MLFIKGCFLIKKFKQVIASELIDNLVELGADVYIVGGAIRNYLLDFPINDIDIEVYNISYEKIKEYFDTKIDYCNDKFKTVKIGKYEIALPRSEKKIGHSYDEYELDFEITSLVLASQRRDFTINALMFNYQTNQLYDFHNGLKDIETKTLRLIDPTIYQEDSIRVLRLLKYHTIYNLSINCQTYELSQKMSNKLWVQPPQLVASYFKEIITHNNLNILTFFDLLQDFLLVTNLKEYISYNKYHPEKQLFKHVVGSLMCLSFYELNKRDYYLLFVTLLFHDYGKLLETTNHPKGSVEIFRLYQSFFLQKKKDQQLVTNLIHDHMNYREFSSVPNKMQAIKRKYQNKFYLLEIVGTCDFSGRSIDYNIEYMKQEKAFYEATMVEKYRCLDE